MSETPSSAGKFSLWDLWVGGFHLCITKWLERPGLICYQGKEFLSLLVELVQVLSVLGRVQATQHLFFLSAFFSTSALCL